jgi:hypothetical protein
VVWSRRGRITSLGSAALLVGIIAAEAALLGFFDQPPRCNPGEDARTCQRVLFIGNSYTYVNDLPVVFARLAVSGGHRVEAGMLASGGASLTDHTNDPETQRKLASAPWAYVVLQEQSVSPALPYWRDHDMYPAARTLVAQVEAVGATPVFFMTWAHRDGWPDANLDYEAMQQNVNRAYTGIADELGVPVAPVGFAWAVARDEYPAIELWQGDGSHPGRAGTYLAACVFYATIFGQSPAGLAYHGGLSDREARELQSTAAAAVLGLPTEWNLR